jgi:hypothetical protein
MKKEQLRGLYYVSPPYFGPLQCYALLYGPSNPLDTAQAASVQLKRYSQFF